MADVEVELTGNASSLKQAFEEIKQEVKNTGDSVKGLSTQFVTAFAAIQGAIIAAKAAFSWIANVPQQAARLENLQTKFSTLMGDAEAAGTLLKDLWKDAANGAFSLEEMADAARPLTTVFSDTSAIREWTQRFADIAAGSGVAAQQLSTVYARAVQLGKVDSRAVEGLAKQGIPIYKELGAVLGVTADKVKDLAAKGAISADQYAAALRRLTDEGGAYYQMSSKLSNTTSGSWDTLTESVNILVAALGQPINDAIRPLLQEVATAVQELTPQIQAFAEGFVSALSGVAELLSPIISTIGDLIGMMGGAKTVVAAAAAALLLYAGNGKAAVVETVSLRTQVGGLVTTLKGLSLASVANGFKAALASMRSTLASSLVGMKVAWNIAWTTMATVTRVAMVAVKAAIVSTGIGLIIVGIGEALSALYSWFMGNKEAAEQAAAATRQFNQSLRQISKSASQVKTKEQYKEFMQSMSDRIDDLYDQKAEAVRKKDEERVKILNKQIRRLREMKENYEQTLPLQIKKAQAEERAAQAAREYNEYLREQERKIKEIRSNIYSAYTDQRKKLREDYLSGLDTELQIKLRLSDAGFQTLDELEAAMHELERKIEYDIRAGDDEKYREYVSTYNTIVKLRKDAADAAAKEAEQTRKTQEELAKQRADAELDYNRKIALLEAEQSMDEKRLELLKREQRIEILTAEYRRQGLENALELAQQMVEAELAAEIAREDAEKKRQQKQQQTASRMGSTWIQDSRSTVGGGGLAHLVGGGPMLSESKKQTSLLREVREEIRRKKAEVRVSGNVTAVLDK